MECPNALEDIGLLQRADIDAPSLWDSGGLRERPCTPITTWFCVGTKILPYLLAVQPRCEANAML